ncbi:hypothetical protein F53441_5625 [Fusarium austroafricanum]|uniref:Uncharacterized protein n=1 Tax=Fusarium austroafricanum TaxID=2364996 RepID=A0A8H4KLB1_9HYPO|nr:hypothetical protein F53441_5625 [Fusarium austroafricanum]
MTDAADRVFHTLELAQQIVFELELKDFFRALAITRALWEGQIPDCVWEEHFMRLGYPDYAIRRTSQPLRACYMCISQAIDAINHEVSPSSTLLKMKDKCGGKFVYSRCHEDMTAPLVFQSSWFGFDVTDVFMLDLEELRLLHAKTKTSPDYLTFKGSTVIGFEYKNQHDDIDNAEVGGEDSEADEESDEDEDREFSYETLQYGGAKYVVLRKLEDWSLIAKFDPKHSGINESACWWKNFRLYDEFLIVSYHLGQEKTLFEIWDSKGSKHGEIVFPAFAVYQYDYHSSFGNHYLTIYALPNRTPKIAQTWNLDRVELVFEHTMSEENLHLQARNGILYKYSWRDPLPVDYWAVDGRSISRKASEMLWKFSPLSGRAFSDGTKVIWEDWLTLYTSEGDIVRRYDLKNNEDEGCYLEGGILFDRFFFSIFWFEESSCASLVVYSKTGEELTSMLLERQDRVFTWFVDVMGRLVLVYEDDECQMDELEMIDFRGISV